MIDGACVAELTYCGKLHVGGTAYTMYREQVTTPALAVRTNGNVCYVKLAENDGYLNISIKEKTYHAVE